MPIIRSLIDKFDRKRMIITITASVVALGTTIGVIAGTSHKKAENIKVSTQYIDSNAIKLDTGYGVSAKQIYLKLVNSGSITESDFQLGKPKDGFRGSFVIYANAAAEFNIRDTQKLTITYEDGSEKKDFTESGDYNEVIEVYSDETGQTYKFRVEFTVLTKSVYVEPTTLVTTTTSRNTDAKTTSVTAFEVGKTIESTVNATSATEADTKTTDKSENIRATEEKGTEAQRDTSIEEVTSKTPVKTEAPTTQPPTNPPTQPVVTNPPVTQPEPTQPPQTQPVVEEPIEYDPIAESRALCRSEEDLARFDYVITYLRSIGVTSELQLAGTAGRYSDFCRWFGEENVVLDDLDDSGLIRVWRFKGYDDETGEEIWTQSEF